MTDNLTAEEIFNKIAQKYKGQSRTTKVSIVESETRKNKTNYKKIRDKKSRSKILWILVETNKLRKEIRQEIADIFDIRNFYTSTRSSVEQIQIKNFRHIDNISEIRIMFKPFSLRNYRWENEHLLEILGKSKLGKPVNMDEINVLKEVNKKIFEMGGSVTIKIKNKTYKDVIGFNAGPSGAKADFEIINSKGQSIGWISYKAGNTSKDFQQYGGITKHAGNEIYNHPQVKEFREKIVKDKNLQDEIKNKKKSVFIRIKRDNKLKNLAVFGKQFGSKNGINNVNWFAQGKLNMKAQNNFLIIDFDTKLVQNGRVYQLNRDYDPIIAARKGESSRRIIMDTKVDNKETQITVSGIRGGIFPEGLIESRNAIDMSGF